jgi:ferrous iron transport protein B
VTVVTMARESSWSWAAFSVVGSTGLAFVMAVLAFNVSKAFL